MVDTASRLAGYESSTALIEGGTRVTYGELRDRVRRTAGALRALDIPDGGRVAVAASPTTDGIIGYLGVQAAGLVPVMLSTRAPLAESQSRFAVTDTDVVVLGTADDLEVPSQTRVVAPAGSDRDDVEVLAAEPVEVRLHSTDDPAVVLYTSGVSGIPRPVILTYGNMYATRDGLIGAPGSGLDQSVTAYAGLPISHVFGLNSIVSTVLRAGGRLVLNDGFQPEEVADLVARHRITMLGCVPIMWKALAGVGTPEMFSTVTRATYSAAPMPPAVRKDVADILGLEIAGGFGLTESAGTVVHDDPAYPTPGTVGLPLGDMEIRLVDPAGHDAVNGDPGEIWLRGSSIATTYLDGTPVERTEDGWYQTGDVGIFDDEGRLAIVDRKKDVINVSGFNVSPAEVESALDAHPAVATSVVVGDIDDDIEVVVAHVVPVGGADVTEAELIEHCRQRLSRYKVPRRISLQRELPLTESGKAVRRLLGTA